ncbi:N-acetyltransferase [Actinoplanes sp. OR16]|uniref:GNAT family N-acetyltransferase n=1 Tax=Actinoplanes sp. OR16 TaxID=946334 RepID=UPI000F6E4AB0|nr:GNAT family N-acetyltransferase [Actinoplanes sp. OR16]BBH63699.1 N-acetyltransferase [Actinoplanes sp. OR16]
MQIRQATPDDAAELLRLRAVMLQSFPQPDWNDDWREPARQILLRRLAEPLPTMAAFVADRPDGTGLAACAVGVIEERLGNPMNLHGLAGYVFSVVTDPDQRRRGYSRACMTALLDWFRSRGVSKVDLRASEEGEPLYESLGFRRTPDPAMRVSL